MLFYITVFLLRQRINPRWCFACYLPSTAVKSISSPFMRPVRYAISGPDLADSSNGLVQADPGHLNRLQGGSMASCPLPVAEQPVHPVHVLRSLQGIDQPEQVIMFRQLAGARTPEIVQLAGKLGADVILAAIIRNTRKIGQRKWIR